MKRKLAFLMATVMTLSMLPMNTALASTSNRLSGESTTVSKKTLFLEPGYLSSGGYAAVSGASKISYMIEGSELVLVANDTLRAGDKINISLTNADFFFRHSGGAPAASYASGVANNTVNKILGYKSILSSSSATRLTQNLTTTLSGYSTNNYLPGAATVGIDGNTATASDVAAVFSSNTSIFSSTGSQFTYNPARGLWYPDTSSSSSRGGHYYRIAQTSKDSTTSTYSLNASTAIYAKRLEVPYDMEVNYSVANGATISVLAAPIYDTAIGLNAGDTDYPGIYQADGVQARFNDKDTSRLIANSVDFAEDTLNPGYIGDYIGSRWEIRIPLVSLSYDVTADIKVTVSPTSNTTSVTSGTWVFGSTSGTSTTTYVNDPQTARDEFDIDVLYIQENRLRSLNTGALYIIAPSGFEWNTPDPSVVKVGVEGGLDWRSVTTHATNVRPYGIAAAGYALSSSKYVLLDSGSNITTAPDYYLGYKPLGVISNTNNNYSYVTGDYNYYNTNNTTTSYSYDVDRSTLILVLEGLIRSGNYVGTGNVTGSVFIKGLKLYADENAPFGPIYLTIQDIKDSGASGQTDVLAGTRVDWTISLTAGTPTTLVNGRYETSDPYNADDITHKTARVTFQENTISAWWAGRYTNFTLNEQAKFRKVRFVDADNMVDETYLKNVGGAVYFVNDGTTKYTRISFNGNVMTMNNYLVKTDEKAKLNMDIWVSVESGYTGDITLGVDGSAIADDVPAVVIAKAVDPITIATTISDTLIGYQWQRTSDIEITEVGAGYLQKGKTVLLSVTDLVSNDMVFGSDAQVEVLTASTSGGLTISNFSSKAASSVNEGTTSLGLSGGTISFDIKSASTTPSTIRISNVSVKIDRTVPVTNLTAYKVVAWGEAIAPNYMYYNYNSNAEDRFNTPGIMADYIKVVSSAGDKASVLTQEVRVPIGESYYVVNGRTVEMDAKAYISPKSSSTMVPLRFVSYAFGLTEEQVIWDGDSSSVTIVHPSRIVQFTINSSTMLLNNVPTKMLSPEGYEVTAELTNERTYVPFRALGNAFGIPVEWDGDTQTAIYNKGANDPTILQ